MALQLSGVELVVKNFSGFMGAMGRVNAVIQKQGDIATKSAQAVTAAGARVESANRAYQRSLINQENAVLSLTRATRNYATQRAKVNQLVQSGAGATQADIDRLNNLTTALFQAQNNFYKMGISVDESSDALERQRAKYDELVQGMGQQFGGGGGGGGGIVATIGTIGSKLAMVTTVIFAVIGAFTVLSSAVNAVLSPIKALVSLVGQGLVAAFNLVKDTVLTVGAAILKVFAAPAVAMFNWLKGKAQEVVSNFGDVLAEFQRFQIMFVSLQARDISNAFGIEMADAFQRAIGPAKDLFNWVKQLAVTTPFTAKGITETLAMANAMGLTTTQAKDLTAAVGNFTAGMGLTEEHMYRIIYNFGQMFAQGKVTGREFRDLAISFVPVWRMLDDMAVSSGKTTKEFQKLAFEGGVPVIDFFNEFIQMANEDFPGAMERMAKTWEGVIGNAKDFVQVIIGVNTFGAVFNKITGAMADSLQELIKYLTPISEAIGYNLSLALGTAKIGFENAQSAMNRFRETLKLPTSVDTSGYVGAIAKIAVVIREVGNKIGDIIQWISDNLNGGFKGIADAAGTWGWNIIAVFANAMATAVDKLIIPVINYITGVLSYWLEGHSPPKAFPDLPKWGMDAMAEYLRGFTMADFDALEGIQGPLKEALSILVETGKIGEAAAGRLYKDISMAIAEALSTGVIDEGLFERIARAAGPFGKEIAKLSRLQIQLAQATNALAAAEKALEEARKRESQTRAAINVKVREYNAMLRAGADKATLTAKLAEVNAQEEAARLATQERVRQEALVETMNAQVEALQEAVKLQERLVSQLLDITKEQIIKVTLDTSGAKGALDDLGLGFAGASKKADIPFSSLRAFVQADEAATKAYEARKAWQDALQAADKWFADFEKKMAGAFDPLIGPGGSMSKLTVAWKNLSKIFEGGAKDDGKRPWDTISSPKSNLQKAIEMIEGLSKAFDPLLTQINLFLTLLSLWSGKASEPLGKVDLLTKAIKFLSDEVAWVLQQINLLLLVFLPWRIQMEQTIVVWDELKERFWDFVENSGKWFDDIFADLVEWGNSLDDSGDKSEKNFGKGGRIWMAFSGLQPMIAQELIKIGGVISTWVVDAIKPFVDWGNDTYNNFRDAFIRFENIWLARLGNLLYWATYKFNKIKENIKSKIEEARDKVKDAMDKIQTFVNGIKTAILESAIGRIIAKLQGLIEKIKNALRLLGVNIPSDPAHPDYDQFGGKLDKNKPTIVGENGWEMLVKGTTGTILNQAQIANVINSAYDAVASYGARPMLYQTVMSAPVRSPMATSVNNTLNVNFGGVVIANDMDMATFEARVRNVVRQEFS